MSSETIILNNYYIFISPKKNHSIAKNTITVHFEKQQYHISNTKNIIPFTFKNFNNTIITQTSHHSIPNNLIQPEISNDKTTTSHHINHRKCGNRATHESERSSLPSKNEYEQTERSKKLKISNTPQMRQQVESEPKIQPTHHSHPPPQKFKTNNIHLKFSHIRL